MNWLLTIAMMILRLSSKCSKEHGVETNELVESERYNMFMYYLSGKPLYFN